ncbi:MAG TPA: serine/threonine-protein kinase [Polyangia bacterium]|nr:serine/threonine-protein kinase [Polyangia bacterium]
MSATASMVNQTIGNYRVIRLLGEGGMGVVYLAQHPVIGRKVAIKLLHAVLARDADIVSRFFNEARAIHMIAHENIVEILDFGQTTDGQPYFIMEYLEGESLSEAVSRGPMPPAQVEAIGVQMCRALSAAHAKGIVHRDLKPHNVQLCQKADGALEVKILDFGVAKILASPDGAQSVKTRTGSLMGTPLYMSPEQCKGSGVLDHRTDIYSLGVMLFEMLAGRPPFMAEGVGELFAKHMLQEAPQLLDFAPSTPPQMAAAVMKSLAKDPADRFQSMDDFRKALTGEMKLALPPMRGAVAPGQTELAPRLTMPPKASTTLSSATSELDDSMARPARTRNLAIVGGGALAAILLAVVLMPKKHAAVEPAPRSPAAEVIPPPPSPELAPPPAPKPVPTTVTIRFEAEPTGAHVIDQKDGADLGTVPVEVQLAKGGDPSKYALRLAGYREVPITATTTADRTMHVVLDKVPAPVAAPTASSEPARHRAPAPHHTRRARSVIDEDGLATPSF